MKKRIPQLDAVRGIAILIVMVHNSLNKFPTLPLQRVFAFGWMGVDLFFVLSGFLITGILVDTRQSQGYFKNFYARRCLRIWPLYYSVLIFMLVFIPLLYPAMWSAVAARSSPRWAFPFFLQNFVLKSAEGAVGPLGVTWSVAIEEQFYLVWAVVVRYCPPIQLRRIAAAVICLSPILRFGLSLYRIDLYSNFFCRFDGLMAGGLLALIVHSNTFQPGKFLRVAWLLFLVALPLAVAAESIHARWLTLSFSAVASAAFVYLALFARQAWFRAVMANRALVYTGTISYGLYLLHKIPFDLLQALHLDRHSFSAFLSGLAASYILAALSWNLLEKPFLGLKRFFEFRRGTLYDPNDRVASIAR